MSNKIGRNQRPCICGKDIKYKMCCDSQNTKLNYWEKDKVKKTSSNNIDTSGWKPKLEKGRINFNDEF